MALISFGYRIDMFAIDPPTEVGSYIVAYDLDGFLKQKDHLGVVTLVAGAGGPQGPPGPVGPAGLTWSGPWIATQSYSENYAVGYGSASWWCISAVTGSSSNPSPDVDTTHWTLLAAQGSPGSQGGTGSPGLQGPQGPLGINWIGDWIINVYDVRDAVYYNGSSYICIASTVGTETLSPDTNTACWDIISLKGDVGPQGATGSPGVSGATGSTLQDIFYNIGGTVSATNSTSSIYRTGNIGIGTASPSTTLHVYATQSGAFRLDDGSQGNGYILKSDSNGVASWTPLSSVGISGSVSYIPVFTGTSSLGNSILYIEPFYGRALIINPGRTLISPISYLSVQRGQSQVDIILGNPGYGQNSGIVSDNTDGFDVSSKGPLVFNSGPSYNEAMRISTNGYVGIGLTTSSTKLHIYATQSGAFRLEDGTQGNNYILTSDSNGVATWTPLSSIGISGASGSIPKFTGTSSLGNSRFYEIGTAGYYGSGSSYVSFLPAGNTWLTLNRSQSSMNFILGNPQSPHFQVGQIQSTNTIGLSVESEGYTSFNTGPTYLEKMRITSGGNVGIGLTAPSTKLHVYATQSGAFRLEDGTQGNNYILTSDSNGVGSWTNSNIYWIKDVNTIYNSNTGAIVLFGNTASSPLTGLTSSPVLIIQGNNYTTYGGNNQNPAIITFMATQNNNYPSDNAVTGIQSSDYNYGNVRAGIYFQSEVSNAGRPSIVFRTGSILTEIMRISQAGNIGIGTASPSTKLHVYATQSGAFRLQDGTQGNNYILTSDSNGVATWTASIYATDSNVVHKTGNENISGVKTFQNIGFLTNVVVQNYNTNTSSSALYVLIGNPGMGIKSENTSSGIGIYSNSTSTGLNYVGANSGVITFSVNKTGDVYASSSVSIGTGTASNSRFLVSSSGGTNSLVINEQGDAIFRGDTTIIGATLSANSSIPAGSITFGNKTSIYSPGDRQIVIGTDNLSGYNYQYGWKFTDYQITNLWGNPIEVQNTMGTIGNLFVGSNYTIAGYGSPPSQKSTLFVKGTTASIMRVVGTGATWSNSQSIFEINDSGAVSIGTSQSMSDSKLFIQSSTSSTTIGSNVMLDLYNGDTTASGSQVSELSFSADASGSVNAYNTQHRYAIISGYATTWNNLVTGGGIKFSTRATTGSSLVTSLVIDPNGGVYNTSRGSSNTIYGYQALLTGTVSLNNTAFGYQSLYSNTGNVNTALGYLAGSLISGTTSGATNSSNSVFIGYDTRPQADGQSNQIVIGCTASGNGSNSVTLGNDSITKTILKGNVGIGVTGPSTNLHIYKNTSGALRLEDGTQGNGYILTSDTNGVASWTSTVAVITTTSSITTNTLDNNGLSQINKCVIIDNGTYSISLTVDTTSGFNSTYLKHGTASISFVQGSGRTLIQVDGTLVLNGSVGSSATIISYGTTDYLRVNNA